MAKTLYFAGETELTEKSIHHVGKEIFGTPVDHTPVYVQGEGWNRGYVKVTRVVRYKSNPSKHECDARCMNASGRTMNCECACGGKNHGKGAFKCD